MSTAGGILQMERKVYKEKIKNKTNLQKKMFSFSLIERVILSAGAMLIFSVAMLAIRTCDQ